MIARNGSSRARSALARAAQREPVRLSRRRAARGAPHARGDEPARLDPDSVDEHRRSRRGSDSAVLDEAGPDVATRDELHDRLLALVLTETEGDACENRKDGLIELTQSCSRRAAPRSKALFWVAAERRSALQAVYPVGVVDPAIAAPASADDAEAWEQDAALIELVRAGSKARARGTLAQSIATLGLPPARIAAAYRARGGRRRARGRFTPGSKGSEWCDRRLLARIHRYTVKSIRAEIEPVPCGARLSPLRPHGQGVSTDARGAKARRRLMPWSSSLLASRRRRLRGRNFLDLTARLSDYDPALASTTGARLSGRVAWARLGPGGKAKSNGRRVAPLKIHPHQPVSAHRGRDLCTTPLLSPRGGPGQRQSAKVAEFIRENGASFFDEIDGTRLLRTQIEETLAELVAAGQIISDSFAGFARC